MSAFDFSRKTVRRRQRRKIYFIVTEGERTEKNYFRHMKECIISCSSLAIRLEVIPCGKKSDPAHLKKYAESIERCKSGDSSFSNGDEVWIVLDVDGRDKILQTGTSPLSFLFKWESGKDYRHVALSNPQFELWIAMHDDSCNGVKTKQDCLKKVKKYHPTYTKTEIFDWVDENKVKTAISNGKAKDNPPCSSGKCPQEGITTVYRLVEKIMYSQK